MDGMRFSLPCAWLLALVLLTACGSSDPPSATPTPEPSPTVVPTATPVPVVRRDIRVTRLVIPALQIDSPVQPSYVVPNPPSAAPAGCPPDPGDETLTVPNQGIATPDLPLEGTENKVWIFGHSRYLSARGLLFSLEDISLGDEVRVDGLDRASGAPVDQAPFRVTGIFIADKDSGEELLFADDETEMPKKPQVVLQTSIREQGAGKQWILSQAKLQAKATNLVQGDLADPCKYLLLYVVAEAV
jgi:hypothetical protein